jgi:hypothetical protein
MFSIQTGNPRESNARIQLQAKKKEAKARLDQDKAIACKATGIVDASKSSHITKNNKRQAKKSQHKA